MLVGFGPRGLLKGEDKGKGRSYTKIAFGPHPPAVHFDKPLHKGQSEACTAIISSRGGIELSKFLEEPGNILLSDSEASIGHADFDRVVILYSADRDKALCSELGRIAHKVEYNLSNPDLISPENWQSFGNLHLRLDLLPLEQGLRGGHHALNYFSKIDHL